MIDSIENIFDNNYEVIENLEIIEIMLMKFLNACYNNEWSKKGGGLITILIVIKRFSKNLIYKYLKQIIRAVFLVTNNYPSSVKIKYEDDSEQIITEIITIFIKDSEKEMDDKAKEQFYNTLLYFQEEILNNLHAYSDYPRKIAYKSYLLILANNIRLRRLSSLFMLIDKIPIDSFFKYYYLVSKDFNSFNNDNFNNLEYLKEVAIISKDPKLKINQKLDFLISNLSQRLELNFSNFSLISSYAKALKVIIKTNPDIFIQYLTTNSLNLEGCLKLINNLISILVADMFLYLEITKKLHEIQFNSKFKYFFIEKFYSTKLLHLNLSVKVDDVTKEIENDLPDNYIEDIMKYIFQTHHNYIFEQYNHTNNNYTSVDSHISEIFPILSNKIKMLKHIINVLKYIISNKSLLPKIRESENIKCSDRLIERFNDLKNKCTNLIFRFIIYREEHILLKVSKHYVRKLLKIDTSTKNLLPEEELKKCIKPVLEQVAGNKLLSFKLIKSLGILIKLLSTNFNDTLGKKLLNQISKDNNSSLNINNMENQALESSFVFAVLSLFSHLKATQIKDLFPELFDIIIKYEREAIIKVKSQSIFDTMYKKSIIKLLSSFPDNLADYLTKKASQGDFMIYYIYKKIILDNSAYVIRETFFRLFHNNLSLILEGDLNENNSALILIKVLQVLVIKSPALLYADDKLLIKLNDYFEYKSKNLYTNLNNEQLDIKIDTILKCIAKINMSYFQKYNNHSEIIFNLVFYSKKTKNARISEKIKFYIIKEMYADLNNRRMCKIMFYFNKACYKFCILGYLNLVLKYLINPLLIHYIREKKQDDYIEKYFVKYLFKNIFNDENKKYYNDATNLEIIKLMIIVVAYFLNPNRENNYKDDSTQVYLNSIASYLSSKYVSSSHTLMVYSCLGLTILSLLFNKQGEKILNTLNLFFFKQNLYDYLNVSNLCFDIIIPYSMSKADESLIVIKNIKNILVDRNVNILQLFHIFSLILKNPDLFLAHKLNISNLIMQFLAKSLNQHVNSTINQKKLMIQLFGLIIYWYKDEKFEYGDEKFLQLEKMKENILAFLNKYYRIIICQSNDNENLEIARKYLMYYKELAKFSEFSVKKFFLYTENEQNQQVLKSFIIGYLYLLKIAIIYCKKETILQNIEYFFYLLKQINAESSVNIKAINDTILLIKCIINESILDHLNVNNVKVAYEIEVTAELQITKNIKEILDNQLTTLVKKKGKIIDTDYDGILNSDFKIIDIMKDLISTFRQKVNNINPEKLFELFPHFDFRYFILFYNYMVSNRITPNKNANNKETIESINKSIDLLTKYFFDNWLIYALVILQYLKEEEEKLKKNIFDNLEYEYFVLNNNSLAFLRSNEKMEQIKTEEKLKTLIVDKKISAIELILETVFLGFYFAFQNNYILNTNKLNITKLLLTLIEYTYTNNIVQILDYFIDLYIKSEVYSKEEKNSFILAIIKAFEASKKNFSQSTLFIFISYLKSNEDIFNRTIKEIVKSLLIISRLHEFKVRNKIYSIFTKFNGNNLITKIKWIFQVDQRQSESDSTSWLPYAVDFLINHFQSKNPIVRKLYSSKLKSLTFKLNAEQMVVDSEPAKDENLMLVDSDNLKFRSIINNCNNEILDLSIKDLLSPVRDIVMGEVSISQKVNYILFKLDVVYNISTNMESNR